MGHAELTPLRLLLLPFERILAKDSARDGFSATIKTLILLLEKRRQKTFGRKVLLISQEIRDMGWNEIHNMLEYKNFCAFEDYDS